MLMGKGEGEKVIVFCDYSLLRGGWAIFSSHGYIIAGVVWMPPWNEFIQIELDDDWLCDSKGFETASMAKPLFDWNIYFSKGWNAFFDTDKQFG